MENRLSNLQSATVYLESFLHILSDYKVLLPMEEKCFEMYAKTHRLMEIRWVKHQKTLQGVALRELKINRLRNEKECQNRLKEIAMLEVFFDEMEGIESRRRNKRMELSMKIWSASTIFCCFRVRLVRLWMIYR